MRVTGFRPKEQPLSYKFVRATSLRRTCSVFESSEQLLRERPDETRRCCLLRMLSHCMGVVSFHCAARHLFRCMVRCAMSVQCRVGLVHAAARTLHDAKRTVKVHSRCSELQKKQRDHPVRKGYSCAFAPKLFLLVHCLRWEDFWNRVRSVRLRR